MFSEDNSASDIRNRMLNNVPSDIDKSEGYFVYDALSPASKELELTYAKDDEILKRTSPYTATGADLEKITNPVGVYRKEGGYAHADLTVNGNASINGGDIVQTPSGLKFACIKQTVINGSGTIPIQALEIGSDSNVPANAITQMPVTIQGVVSVTNLQAVTNGYDVENDESLRQRYFERMQTPATSGNKYHYKNWAKEVVGCGDAKVNPLWAGNGTVKVIIVNENKRAADITLINAVAEHIEDNRPIGATVTVVSATEKAINVSVTLVIDTKQYTLTDMQTALENNLKQYFNKIAFVNNYISYASIGNLIFNTPGIIDYSNLLVNSEAKNIPLADEEIPVFGALNLGV